MDAAYWTLDSTYIESVWWHLQQLFDQGLLYEDLKVVPYCPRCGTALSSHELGQPDVYRDEEDESAYVRFRLVDPDGAGLGGGRWGRVARRVDDDAVDAAVEHGRRGEPRADLRRRRRGRHGRRAGRRRHGGGGVGPGDRSCARFGPGRAALRASVRRPGPASWRRRVAGGPGRVRDDRGGDRPGPPGAGLRRDRPPDRPRERPALAEPGRSRRSLHRRRRVAGRAGRPGGQPRHQRPPRVVGIAAPPLPLRPLVPALLALPHAAHLLGQAELVHRHVDPQGRPAGGQPHGGLAPGPHPGRALRRVAREQRRLGPVARPLLGHAAADLALRPGPRALRRLAGRALGPVRAGRDGDRPAPADHRRRDLRLWDVRGRCRAPSTRSTTWRCAAGSSR